MKKSTGVLLAQFCTLLLSLGGVGIVLTDAVEGVILLCKVDATDCIRITQQMWEVVKANKTFYCGCIVTFPQIPYGVRWLITRVMLKGEPYSSEE